MPTRKKQPNAATGIAITTPIRIIKTDLQTDLQTDIQTDIKPITQRKDDKPQQRQSLFLATSRLNRGQRKYCNCLMQVRTQKKIKPYGICRNMSYHIMQANRKQPAFRFMPQKTNCIMNYDYSQYTLADIQALARESGIATHNPKTGKTNNKTTLIQLLTKRYIVKHNRSQPQSHKITGTVHIEL